MMTNFSSTTSTSVSPTSTTSIFSTTTTTIATTKSTPKSPLISTSIEYSTTSVPILEESTVSSSFLQSSSRATTITVSTGTTSASANSLSTADWIGISSGIALFAIIVAIRTLFFFKRQGLLNKSNKQSDQIDNKSPRNIYTTVVKTKNVFENEYEDLESGNKYEELGPTTKSEMKVNVIYNAFESAANESNKQSKCRKSIANEFISDEDESHKMTLNILYDGYQSPKQQGDPMQEAQTDSDVYALPNKKNVSVLVRTDQNDDFYSFAENVTDTATTDAIYCEAE